MGRLRSSLRYKIGALLLLLSLGPFIVVGIIGFVVILSQLNRFSARMESTEDALRSDVVGSNLKGAAVDTAVEIDSYLLERIADVRRWGEESVVVEAARAGDAFVQANRLGNLAPDELRKRLTNELFLPITPTIAGPASAYLFRQLERPETPVVEILVTGRTGINVLVTRPVPRVIQTEEEWWRVALERGTAGIGIEPPHLDETQLPLIGIALPILSPESKEVHGVIRAQFRLSDLQRRITQKATSLNADIRIVMRNGQLVADTSNNHNRATVLNPQFNLVRTFAPATRALTAQPGTEGADFLTQGNDIVGFAHTANEIFYRPTGLSGFKGFDWGVLVSQPEQRALQVLSGLNQVMAEFAQLPWLLGGLLGVISLLVVAVTIGGAVLLSGGITKPLIALSQQVTRVQQGNLEAHVNVHSQDEVGVLSRAFNMMTAGLRERERERDIFGRVVTPEVREKLLAGKLELGGETRRVSVLFSDIRGFSTMVEKMDPQEAVSFLNEYLTEMTNAIKPWGGYINNFIGDAIVVIFGAPVEQPDQEWRAVAAGLMMVERLAILNERRAARGESPIRNGIGISTGAAVAGQIGSLDRLLYTVIGDAVNIAARLEALTKDYPTFPILINGTTAECVKARPELKLKPLGPVKVKGRDEAVEVYAVLAGTVLSEP